MPRIQTIVSRRREVSDLLEHCLTELQAGRVPVVKVPEVTTERAGRRPAGWRVLTLGDLHVHEMDRTGMHASELSSAAPVPTDRWFTLEVIAIDDHLVVRANNQDVVDHHDDLFREGHIALQCFGQHTEVSVRKLLIKEMAADES